MNQTVDPYFDDVGIAWRATVIDAPALAPLWRSRLRRMQILETGGLLLFGCVVMLGCALGGWHLWQGLFGSAGWQRAAMGSATILLVLFGTGVTAWPWLAVPDRGDTETLLGMIERAISKGERNLYHVRLAPWVFAATLLFLAVIAGLVSLGLELPGRRPLAARMGFGVFTVAVVFAGIMIHARHEKRRLARYRHIRDALLNDKGGG
jgi:hypothetical protein